MPGSGLDRMILGTGGQNFKVCLPQEYPGMQLRKSTNLEDKWPYVVHNGCVIQGHIEDGGEWVRLGPNAFLPMKGGDILAVQRQEQPFDAGGVPGLDGMIMDTGGQTFKVCVPEQYPGIQFRKSMNWEDKWPCFAQKGSAVQGQIQDGGEWVRLGPNVFLPMKVGALVALQLQEQPDAGSAQGRPSLVGSAAVGETARMLRGRGDRWRALADSARSLGAAQAPRFLYGKQARFRAKAEAMAIDGRRWASAARSGGLPWAGDWEKAAQAGEEAIQAFRTWEAHVAKPKGWSFPGFVDRLLGLDQASQGVAPAQEESFVAPRPQDPTPPPPPRPRVQVWETTRGCGLRAGDAERKVQAEAEARVRAEAALQDAMELREALRRAEAAEAKAKQVEAESTETILSQLAAAEAAHAEQTSKLEAEVSKRERFLAGLLGKEAYDLCREVQEIPDLLAAVRAQRAAQPELPAAWRELVAALTGRRRDADRTAWEDVLFSAEASRASLAEACRDVRAAVLDAMPPAEEALDALTSARDERRNEHIGALEEAMAGLLASVNCQSAAELDAKVDEARDTVERLQAALQGAAGVLAADPALHTRLPALADGVQATFTEAIAAYRAYGTDWGATAMATASATSATEKAAESFEAMSDWEGCLKCRIHPGRWWFSSDWEGARTSPERQTEDVAAVSVNAPATLSQVKEALQKVREACDEEAQRLSSADPIRGFPLRQLLAAGGDEVELWRLYLKATEGARDAYKALAAEAEQERSVAKLLPQKLAVEGELRACVQAHADAEAALSKAKAEEKKYRRIGKDVPSEIVEEAVAARRALREADARFQAAMACLLKLSGDLPEVARVASSSTVLLPPELLRLWRGCRDLSYFDDYWPLTRGQVGKVHCVRDKDGLHVVKRYELQGLDMGACLAEAALLVRLRHPHVAEVTGIFWDTNKHVFMQMPFYREGDLAQWVSKSPTPTQASVRRACRQVLLALEYLHSFRIVHCDVKPENIFINELGDAFLGDFDVSVDRRTRCTTVQRRHTIAKAHYTPGYDAPELLSAGATPQTDMYAYGVTVAKACGRSIDVNASDISDFVGRLTAAQPEMRLTAGQALQHVFFESTRFSTQVLASCAVCCVDRRPVEKGISCGSAHFVCGDCLRRHVEDELDIIEIFPRRREEHQERQGRIRCPRCPAPLASGTVDEEEGLGSLYKDSDLGRCLPASVADAYFLAKDKVTENRLWRKRQEDLQAEVQRAREQFEGHLPGMQALVQAEQRAEVVEWQLRQVDEAEVAVFLKRKFAGALQCPTCGLGPVMPEGTTNFKFFSRARGGRVRNACLGCNFFSPNRRDWHAWDGHLKPRQGG